VLLGFTASWTLGDYERETAAMIRRLKVGVYLTCESQQPQLLEDPETPPAEDQAEPESGGTVQPIKRRGRRANQADVH
jgi:hypothetical protein